MKSFKICLVIAAVVAAANAALKIKPDEDCSCAGYEALAATCPDEKWPAAIKECDDTSEEYKNYVTACEAVNNFRALKRNKKIKNIGTRRLTCQAWKSFDQRRSEKCGFRPNFRPMKRSLPLGTVARNQPIASAVDWTPKMTPIKDQLNCNSCYAFAAVGMCEWYLKSKSTTPTSSPILSEQTIIDCDLNNGACDGGSTTNALTYISKYGIPSSEYAYKDIQGACQVPAPYAPKYKCPAPVTEYYEFGNDTRLRQLLNVGPVTVGMYAGVGFFQMASGIYVPTGSCAQPPDHAVIIVGYGSVGSQKYWTIKNSWGTNWGDKGYIKLDANTPNMCSLSTFQIYL